MKENRSGKLLLRDWTADEAKASFDSLLDSARGDSMNRIVAPDGLFFIKFVPTPPVPTEDEMGPPVTWDELTEVFGVDAEVVDRLRKEQSKKTH